MASLPGSVRTDRHQSGRIVEQIFADADTSRGTRRCCVQFLAKSISYASERWPDRWSVTLHSHHIRFNVGWVEAFVLDKNGVSVMVAMPRPVNGAKLGRPYPRAKGARRAFVSFRDARGVLPRLERAHRQAMHDAATWRTAIGTRRAHSPGVIDYLWRALGLRNPPSVDANSVHGRALHIVQGGVENGDKRWLERAARSGAIADRWVVPKSVLIGDDVVVYIRGYGLFATARIASAPQKRTDWPNRYGAKIWNVRLIGPPISLEQLERRVARLKWVAYPRSITTPSATVASQLRFLIEQRRRLGRPEITERPSLRSYSLDELYALATRGNSKSKSSRRTITVRQRRQAVKAYIVARAEGFCEHCREEAPFRDAGGEPYLEAHHITRLADEGPDDPKNGIAVCPNCHRRAHYSTDSRTVMRKMKKHVASIERGMGHMPRTVGKSVSRRRM